MATTTQPYPLKFRPIFRERIWGGQHLKIHFGKNLPPGPIGESWELADLPHDKSVITNGPWAGRTLAEVIAAAPEAITGNPDFKGPFPLLIKLLDAQDLLSVQVHPDQTTCDRMGQGDPKTECWIVIAAEPGAFIYKGIKPGTTRDQFAAAINNGTVEEYLDKVPVQPGECHFLPSGTAHAIGAGLLIAEIQQPSDTTYRVFDYNRTDAQSHPRQLHIAEALKSIHFDISAQNLPVTQTDRLVDSPFFTVDSGQLKNGQQHTISKKLTTLLFLKGSGHLSCQEASIEIKAGDCILNPASCTTQLTATTDIDYLAIHLPNS